MRETLLIRLTGTPGAPQESVCLDDTGKAIAGSHRDTLAEAAQQTAGRRVWVLVPNDALLLARANVPTNSSQRARKAVPFALEDQLAEDIDGLHFALAARDAQGQWPVAVVARTDMDEWLARLNAAGIVPDRLLPEALALPLSAEGANTASLLLETESVLLRDQAWSAQVVIPDMLPALQSLLLQRSEAELLLRVWPCAGAAPSWPETVQVTQEACQGGVLNVFVAGLAEAGDMDLLQGPYGRTEQYGRLWRPWRAAAALLLLGVVFSAAQLGLRYQALQSESAELMAQTEAVFKQAFPGGRIVNPRAQMEQQLKALRQQGGADADFLGLLAKLGGVLAATPGLEVNSASFRDGYLDVDLTAGNVQVLDQLKQQISAKGGLKVDIQSATTGADQKVKGRLRIQGAAS